MAIFGKIKKGAEYIHKTFGDFIGIFSFSESNPNFDNESAMELSAFFCGVRTISENIASMSIDLKRRDGRNVYITQDHYAWKLLNRRPNSFQNPSDFISTIIANAIIGKGSLCLLNKVGNEVTEILPVPSGSWSGEIMSSGELRFKVQFHQGFSYYGMDDVLYLKGLSLNGYESTSLIEKARSALGISQALDRQLNQLSKNGGKPSGILSMERELSPEARQKLKESWSTQFSSGNGGIAILDSESKYQSMTMNLTDSQFIENRKFQIEEVARFLGIQPSLLMSPTQSMTFASSEEATRNHITNCLLPWVVKLEQELNRALLGNDPELVFDIDEYSLLRGNFKNQSEYFQRALGAGGTPAWLTVNEVREQCGMNPIDDINADTLALPQHLQSINKDNE